MARYVVAEAGGIPPGDRRIVTVEGISIGVFNIKGEFFALRNRCPHQGGPLCEGKLWGLIEAEVPGELKFSREGEILTCGWHGWEFDIRTGQSWCEPGRLRTRRYDVTVKPGAEIASDTASAIGMIPGPYVAETYSVSKEGQYIVVDLDPNE
jgi:nitrite reductase/ring-hydroxylating ferredoxin subunit